jgi:hypothetical protein
LANTKISDLTDGAPAVGTDVLPVARAGANRRLTVANLFASPTITGTVTASQVVAKWGVPVILASSGTMGNNGAVSAMTALPTTYSGGAWLYLPANAIQAGSAAGFYWFVASSTTAGTVYNSTFDGTSVPAAGTTTAFVSTGPGAFTGLAAGEIVAATVTVSANAVGASGALFHDTLWNNNTAAGNKTFRVRYSGGAGTLYLNSALSTSAGLSARGHIQNRGTSVQVGSVHGANVGNVAGLAPAYGTADTTGATTLVFSLEKATATNHAILEAGVVTLVYGS